MDGTARVQHLPGIEIIPDALEKSAAFEIEAGVAGLIGIRCRFADGHSGSQGKDRLYRGGIWGIISSFWLDGIAWWHDENHALIVKMMN